MPKPPHSPRSAGADRKKGDGPRSARPFRDRDSRGRPPAPGGRDTGDDEAPLWLYGRHAVAAALANPARKVIRLLATRNAAEWLATEAGLAAAAATAEDQRPEAIDRALPQKPGAQGAVHQGLAAYVEPLARARLKDVCSDPAPARPVIVLDQVTDPQNIGAIMRSAAALGARAMIVQDRRTPPLSGALAKAAAGAAETLPVVRAVNIARALEALGDLGYFRAGLAGEGATAIGALPRGRPVALVMGAEGAGLRPLVAANCDGLFRIEIRSSMESLNVSTAAAIALYETTRDSGRDGATAPEEN